MAKWTDYTTDTNPTDTDEVMTLDADKTPKANKRVTLSTLSDYFLDKLASKVFAKLETQNKTVIGALNELNSKRGITTFDGKDYSKRFCNIYIEKGATKPSSVLVIGYEGVGIAKFASMSAGNYSASFVNIEGTILSTVDYNKVAIDFGDTNRSVTVIHPTAVTISLKAAESK